jgi:hypothetical protein
MKDEIEGYVPVVVVPAMATPVVAMVNQAKSYVKWCRECAGTKVSSHFDRYIVNASNRGILRVVPS